jgi:Rieske Fe-S protein
MDQDSAPHSAGNDSERRSFLVKMAAVVCGGIVAIFPFAAGLGVAIDPWRRSRQAAGGGETAGAGNAKFVRICPLDTLTPDGPPQSFPVVADVVDAWTHAPNQRIGMVFLQRTTVDGKPKVVALSAKCPHLGCVVDFNNTSGHFECPCHTSAFAKDGKRLFGPSLRGLDSLEVDPRTVDGQTEVYVAFQRFKPGIAEKESV